MRTWMWLLILGLGLVKLPFAALMLWLPFRSDAALESLPPAAPPSAEEDDDGGVKALPGGGVGPGPWHGRHPRAPRGGRRPRRGPHGGTAVGPAPSPARVRTPRAAPRVGARRSG